MLDQIDHVNLVVDDLEGMVAFYRDVLGMRISKTATISGDWIEKVVGIPNAIGNVVYLEMSNGPRVELIEYVTPKGDRPAGLGKPNTLGLRHLAFRVTEIEVLTERLRVAGVTVFSDPQTVPDAQVTYSGGVRKTLVYFHDPEGNLLELCAYR